MVHQCDLLTPIQLEGLSKRKSSSLILEALLNKVSRFSVNDTLYDLSEVILELMATGWTYTKRPCDYTVQHSIRVVQLCMMEILTSYWISLVKTSDNIRMTTYFDSIIAFLTDMERKTEVYV